MTPPAASPRIPVLVTPGPHPHGLGDLEVTNIWNDFLFGSTYAFGNNAPIMVALNNIVNTSIGEKPYNVHMAVAMLAAVPTLIVYVVAGKHFVRGLMAGSVKC